MKKLLFLTLFIATNAYAKRIVLNIPNEDIAVVENDVLDAEQWIRKAWAGKVNKSRDRMIKAEIARSLDEKVKLPATRAGIIRKAMRRKDYKNRKQRETELNKAR